MKIHLVGGAVRDKILGVASQDSDYVVVGATHDDMIDEGFKPINAAEFPIFTKDGDEYALCRKERKVGVGYKGFDISTSADVTLEDDLFRRDLTINSIAMSDDGYYIDPYGGISDIESRVLRHTSPAFSEDPVRILRVARFMAQLGEFGFSISSETLQLMSDMVASGEVGNLTPERVWKELEKALSSSHPWRFFEVLRDCGALKELMPEIHALIDVPQPIAHHPENCVFQHTMLSLQQSTILGNRNPIINFSVLAHDLGKALSPKETLPAHHGHEESGIPLVSALCDRLKTPNSYRDLALKVTSYHLRVHKIMDMKASKVVDLLDNIGAMKSEKALDRFIIACESDAKGRLGLHDKPYPQAQYIKSIYRAVVNMDIKPIVEKYAGQGSVIGEQIRQAQIRTGCRVKHMFNHLQSRHLNPELYPGITVAEDTITFPLWNLSGQLVGYQQYRPNGDKIRKNNPKLGRYFTCVPRGTVTAWDVDRIDPKIRTIYLLEGVFKACRFHNYGLNAIAVIGNNPKHLRGWLASLGYEICAICDGDKAGMALAKFGSRSHILPDGVYVDDMTEDEFIEFIALIKRPESA